MNITVIDTGYLVLVTAPCLSDVGIELSFIVIDEKKIYCLKNGILPIYIPRLKEIVVMIRCSLNRTSLRRILFWTGSQGEEDRRIGKNL